jgi:hypothetical protein
LRVNSAKRPTALDPTPSLWEAQHLRIIDRGSSLEWNRRPETSPHSPDFCCLRNANAPPHPYPNTTGHNLIREGWPKCDRSRVSSLYSPPSAPVPARNRPTPRAGGCFAGAGLRGPRHSTEAVATHGPRARPSIQATDPAIYGQHNLSECSHITPGNIRRTVRSRNTNKPRSAKSWFRPRS